MADRQALRDRLSQIRKPLFAVLDGAQFDDLPADLDSDGFLHRSLYLDHGDGNRDMIRTAPQLVWLDRDATSPFWDHTALPMPPNAAVVERLLELVGDRPAAVFWQCPVGGDALYRHLRTINRVRVPRESLPLDEQKLATQATIPVLFRHADANVMAQVLGALNAVEISRFFGPTSSILFAPDDHWSPRGMAIEAKRPADLPSAQAGMLELSPKTMQRIDQIRTDGLRAWAISEFSSEGQRTQITNAFARAVSYELEQKDEIWDFIRLDLTHGPNFEERPEYHDAKYYLAESDKSPRERIYYASEHCSRVVGGR